MTYKHDNRLSMLLPLAAAVLFEQVAGDCLADKALNDIFELDETDGRVKPIPRFGSCCQYDVCGLQCPVETPPPSRGTYSGCCEGIWIMVVFLQSNVCVSLFLS